MSSAALVADALSVSAQSLLAAVLECPRINLINPSWNLLLGGTLELDMLFNSARPVAPGVPFFLAPGSPTGAHQNTFDAHARQSNLYAVFSGPEIGNLKAGGLVLANFFNDAVIVDRYGFLPIQAYGDLKNEDWRVAAGLQIDIFAPLLPTVLPFSYLAASGNAGVYRGQFRIERFLHPSDNQQWTITAGISDPTATTINNVELSEDNGWPDVEMRVAWAAGPLQQVGLLPQRPFEVGVSSVVGQLRTINALTRVVANVWGLAGDFRWRATERFGFAGEVYTGQALGTYGAGVFQNVNSTTFEAVHATGGWLETYYYLTPCLHSHVGFGIDDPVNRELAASQIGYNSTIFTNLIWDITKSLPPRRRADLPTHELHHADRQRRRGLPDSGSDGASNCNVDCEQLMWRGRFRHAGKKSALNGVVSAPGCRRAAYSCTRRADSCAT